MLITEPLFWYFSCCLLQSLFVLVLLQVCENVQWEATARKLSKPVLLPLNCDIFTVCADVPQHQTSPERSPTKVFPCIWWDAQGLQQCSVLKPPTQVELMSFMLNKSGPDSPTEQSYESRTL